MMDYRLWYAENSADLLIEILNEDFVRIAEIQKEYLAKGYFVTKLEFPFMRLSKVAEYE